MKTTGKYLFFGAVILLGMIIRSKVMCHFSFSRDYGNKWELADKSSTLSKKTQLVGEFVDRLKLGIQKGQFSENDAIFLATPNNSLEANMEALSTLQDRLREIEGMDPKSFEYNTAIQQITQQEQGEAGAMIGVIQGCYQLGSYPLSWRWVGTSLFIVSTFAGILGIFLTFEGY